MKLRAGILITLICAALAFFAWAQKGGRLVEAEQWFLDYLVANARSNFFQNLPEKSADVVLVEIREEDKGEYDAWPPSALDYVILLKRLAAYEPEVVAIPEVLSWQNANPQVVNELRQTMLPFPSIVLGYEIGIDPNNPRVAPDAKEFILQEMPRYPHANHESPEGAKFARVARLPERSLRIAARVGFTNLGHPPSGPDERGSIYFAAAHDGSMIPSFAAQAVSLYRRMPFASQSLRLGTGARISLGDQWILPLNRDGSLKVLAKPAPARINALDIITPDLLDDAGKEGLKALEKNKLIVLAVTSQGQGTNTQLAQVIAQGTAMPTITKLGPLVEWGAALAAFLLSLTQLKRSRFGAIRFGVIMMALGMGTSLLAFHTILHWWSPLMAIAPLLISTAFCFLWPHRPPSSPSSDSATQHP